MDKALEGRLYSPDAETAVLGRALNGHASDLIKLDQDDFSNLAHRIIYRTIVKMFTEATPVDPLTVSDQLEREKALKKCGGLEYLINLDDNSFGLTSFDEYVRILKERSAVRKLYRLSEEIKGMISDGHEAKDITNTMLADVTKAASVAEVGLQPIKTTINDTLNAINEGMAKKNTVKTGFPTLDDMLGGLKPQTMHVISGRAGMGKTAFALNVAFNAALRGAKVAIFSLEMSSVEVTLRLLSSLSGYSTHDLRTKFGSREVDTSKVVEAIDLLYGLDLYIDDSALSTVHQISSKCKTMQATEGLDLVVVDYINLMEPGTKTGNRVSEVSEMTRHLKLMAKDLNTPVIALSQTNRGVEHRDNKRPGLADLRESGSIEQDADSVMFLYRDSYYSEGVANQIVEDAELLVRKNRHGKTGTVDLLWKPDTTTFVERSKTSFG